MHWHVCVCVRVCVCVCKQENTSLVASMQRQVDEYKRGGKQDAREGANNGGWCFQPACVDEYSITFHLDTRSSPHSSLI